MDVATVWQPARSGARPFGLPLVILGRDPRIQLDGRVDGRPRRKRWLDGPVEPGHDRRGGRMAGSGRGRDEGRGSRTPATPRRGAAPTLSSSGSTRGSSWMAGSMAGHDGRGGWMARSSRAMTGGGREGVGVRVRCGTWMARSSRAMTGRGQEGVGVRVRCGTWTARSSRAVTRGGGRVAGSRRGRGGRAARSGRGACGKSADGDILADVVRGDRIRALGRIG